MDASEALEMWERVGEIDAEHAARLRRSLASHTEPERANRIIYVLVSIGAVLIGGGLLLFIASQWDQSSPVRRLLLLFAVYALTVSGAALCDRQRLQTTASGLWFLSSIVVGVNIFLVGQVFNLPLTYWQGTLLWLLATLAMGWASPSSAQGWLAVPLGVLTLGWIFTPSSQFFEQGEFLFSPGGLRPLLPIVGLALVSLSMLIVETDFAWLRRPAQAFGACFVAVPLTASTFHPAVFAWIFQIDARPVHLVILLLAVGLVAASWNRQPAPLLGIGLAAIGGLMVVFMPQVSDADRFLDGTTLPWLAESFDNSEALFGAYTALMLGLSVATIVTGHRFENKGLVNVGFAAVSVLLFALYVGRIAGELPTSLAVIVGGLLLVGGAIFLERKRREVAGEIIGKVSA